MIAARAARPSRLLGGALALLALTAAAPATKPKPVAKPAAAKAQASKKAGKPKSKSAAPVVPPGPIASNDAARVMAWVAASHDNDTLPYIVIDKQDAMLFLFDRKGVFVGQTPVLIGVGVGDDSTPGVGAKSLSDIGPAERTTPAGRYVARFGRAVGGTRVLWVDYAVAVAIHAVITTHPKERRVDRLQSPGPDDNRITFGCINVGTRFYTSKVKPMFARGGVVYILPDTKPLEDVFPRVRLLPYLKDAAPPAPSVAGGAR